MSKERLAKNIKRATTPSSKLTPSGAGKMNVAYTPTSGLMSSEDELYNTKRAKTDAMLKNIASMLGLAGDVGGLMSQSKQEKEALALRDKIKQPVFSPRGRNEALARELRDVDARRLNPYGAVAPVADQINLGYQQDLARAQNLSGGQASTAGALGQAAALRRDANLGALGQAAQGALSQEDARALQISQAMSADDQNRDMLNMYRYQIDSNRAMQEGQAVGEAISSSRLRKLQARNDAWLGLLTSPMFDVNTYEKMIKNSLTSIG